MKITNGSCQRVITHLVRIEQPRTNKLLIIDNATKTAQHFSSKFGELCFRFKAFIKSCGKCMFSSRSRKDFYDKYVNERMTARSTVSNELSRELGSLDKAQLLNLKDQSVTTLANIVIGKDKTKILCKKNGTRYEFLLQNNSEPPKLVIKITGTEFENFVSIVTDAASVIKKHRANIAQKNKILEDLMNNYGDNDRKNLLGKYKKKKDEAIEAIKESLANLEEQQIKVKNTTEDFNKLNLECYNQLEAITELKDKVEICYANIEEKNTSIENLRKEERTEDKEFENKVSEDVILENKNKCLDKITELNELQEKNLTNSINLSILKKCAEITNKTEPNHVDKGKSLGKLLDDALECFIFDKHTCEMTLASIPITNQGDIKKYFLEYNSFPFVFNHREIRRDEKGEIIIDDIEKIRSTFNITHDNLIDELRNRKVNVDLVDIQEEVKSEHEKSKLEINAKIQNLYREKEKILEKIEAFSSQIEQFNKNKEKINSRLTVCEFILSNYRGKLNIRKEEFYSANQKQKEILENIIEIENLFDEIDAIDKLENE